MGARGRRGLTAWVVRAGVRAVARRGVFSLIEAMIPRGVTSRTLARFVSGLKSARDRQPG